MDETRVKVRIDNYPVVLDGNEVPFDMRGSLVALLFHSGLELGSLNTRRNDKIATKIEECRDDHILLSEEDYGIVLNAVDTYEGYDRNSVELIRRVQEAENVTAVVEEVPKPESAVVAEAEDIAKEADSADPEP